MYSFLLSALFMRALAVLHNRASTFLAHFRSLDSHELIVHAPTRRSPYPCEHVSGSLSLVSFVSLSCYGFGYDFPDGNCIYHRLRERTLIKDLLRTYLVHENCQRFFLFRGIFHQTSSSVSTDTLKTRRRLAGCIIIDRQDIRPVHAI